MKVVIYNRVSTDKQELTQQERTVNNWLSDHAMQATCTISDEGVSGGVSYMDRALGTKVLPMLSQGDVLIVAEISRLGRSMADVSKLVNEELKPKGVRLVIVSMGLDLHCDNLTAMDQMILTAFSFAGQLERELLKTRTQSAIDSRKDKLQSEGYFVSKKGRTCTHLGNAKGADLTKAQQASAIARTNKAKAKQGNLILWELLRTCTPGEYSEMATKLNAMGVKTASGKEFDYSRVKTTFHNLKRLYA